MISNMRSNYQHVVLGNAREEPSAFMCIDRPGFNDKTVIEFCNQEDEIWVSVSIKSISVLSSQLAMR